MNNNREKKSRIEKKGRERERQDGQKDKGMASNGRRKEKKCRKNRERTEKEQREEEEGRTEGRRRRGRGRLPSIELGLPGIHGAATRRETVAHLDILDQLGIQPDLLDHPLQHRGQQVVWGRVLVRALLAARDRGPHRAHDHHVVGRLGG